MIFLYSYVFHSQFLLCCIFDMFIRPVAYCASFKYSRIFTTYLYLENIVTNVHKVIFTFFK